MREFFSEEIVHLDSLLFFLPLPFHPFFHDSRFAGYYFIVFF